MQSGLQRIYLRAPRILQNLAISYMGYRQYKERYDARLPEPYRTLFSSRDLSASDIEAFRESRFAVVIQHAATYVPHYRDLMNRFGVNPDDVRISNFSEIFPVLEKKDVVENPSSFHSSANGSYIKLFTSGTSGSPLPIQCTRSARAINYAFFRKLIRENGSDVTARSATFAGRILFSAKESRRFWRKDYLNRTLLLSSYHVSQSSIPLYIAALEQWRPEYIDSYPSAIGEIARYICDRDVNHTIRPRFILTSSETLSDSQKENIRAAFRCPIVDHYGCTEMAINAHSVAGGPYTLEPMYSVVEVEEAKDAGGYSLICTGLLNTGMPLIRYRIGDVAGGVSLEEGRRNLVKSFQVLIGREDDLVITPEGRRVGRLDPAFKGLSGIRQSQIIQVKTNELVVKVVPQDDCDYVAATETLTKNLQSRTSSQMNINVQFVDALELTRAGKLKSVVSLIK